MSASAAAPSTNRRGPRMQSVMVAAFCCAALFGLFKIAAPQTVGEQARRVLQRQLAEHYRDWHVSIGRGTYQPGTGIVFESIRLTPRTAGVTSVKQWWSDTDSVKINRLTVVADLDVPQLLEEKTPLVTRRLVVEGLHATVRFNDDGTSSLATLLPLPEFGPVCPRVDVFDATIDLDCPAASDREVTSTRPVQMHWSELSVLSTCARKVTGSSSDDWAMTNGDAAKNEPVVRTITGKGSSSFSGPIQFRMEHRSGDAAASEASAPRFDFQCQQLTIDDTLVNRLSPLIGMDVCQCESFAGVRWQLVGDLAGTIRGADDVRLQATIHDGHWTDPRLPSKLDQWRGRIDWTPGEVRIWPTRARFGDAICRLEGSVAIEPKEPGGSGQATGAQPRLPVGIGATSLSLSAEGLSIDPTLARVLPERAGQLWDKFQPHGRIDAAVNLHNPDASQPSGWDIRGEVTLRGVDVRFDRFPYPVEKLAGSIVIADGRATAEDLIGGAGGQRVHCGFRVPVMLPSATRAPADASKFVVIQTEGAIAIDEALLHALTARTGTLTNEPPSPLEQFVRSLHPSGQIELAAAVINTDAAGNVSRNLDLRVVGGSLRYDEFPYPLYNVAGRIQIQDDRVRVIGFTANNAGAAKVLCDGLVQLGDASELNLRFRVADIAMDHSLRISLPESSRGVWDSLSPAGTLDRLDVHVNRLGTAPVKLTISASQQESNDIRTDTLTLRPTAIPYRIDVVGGMVRYQDGEVVIENLQGRHDSSRLVADGRCVPLDANHWKLSMNLHSGCRLIPDEELLTTLPPQMARAMRQLDLRGPIRLRGTTNVLLTNQPDELPVIDWSLLLQLEGNRIGDVGPVDSIRGELQISGVSNDEMVRAGGTVAIDSMHAMGLQFTSIRGPFSIVGNDLRLGTLSSPLDPISAQPQTDATAGRRAPIVGTLFGGLVDLSGAVALSTGDFDIGTSVTGGELSILLAELGQSRNDMRGRFDMNLRLDGRLGDMDLLKGTGNARLSGANLYQLPVIVQVLNLLRITPTEDVAFTDGQTEFALFGEDINFNRLMLWGDLVALDGGGTLTRRNQLDLSFNTRVSPQSLFSKVVNPLKDERYTLWTIEVDGALDNPTIRRRALSGFAQTMEAWFPATVRSSTADASP